MTFSLDNAVVYDIETLPNCFTLAMECLNNDTSGVWEISEFRDDRQSLFAWFGWLMQSQAPMIGFNSLHFDYPVIHALYKNPQMTVAEIYAKAQEIITTDNRFGHTIWADDRFAPQIDLFKINHFDNKAKTTSLKALQVNMRSRTVVDSPIPFGQPVSADDIETKLIPYNRHDVSETKRFAHICRKAIDFRIGLIDQFGLEALNFNDTKIGAKILENRLGEEVCYSREPRYPGDNYGRRTPRQTPRDRIALNDIIFPYIKFEHAEFNRVLDYMRQQVLTPEDIEDADEGERNTDIKTKGAFKGLVANVGGIEFKFGTGGIHGSVTNQRFQASDEWRIQDIDVEGLYPNIGIVNRLAPAHLGDVFVNEYARLPAERKLHKKGTVENASLKLASNGTYGNTNNKFSVFYDPLYTMTITINGQLMLCMLAEWLMTVPTFQIIQINTDGITYRIHRDFEPQCVAIRERWQAFTCLKLEDVSYARMWIADVNTYVAEKMDGELKQKGRLWHPDPLNYAASIAEASPPAWHKDLGGVIAIRAAVTAMAKGVDPETYIRLHTDPFDFMYRVKAPRGSRLEYGGQRIQSTTRYYVARNGYSLVKISPPPAGAVIGTYKRANGVTEAEYRRVMAANGGQWDATVCTKNQSKYEETTSNIQAGWKVVECNDASNFDFSNVNYDFYIAEARKLIIA